MTIDHFFDYLWKYDYRKGQMEQKGANQDVTMTLYFFPWLSNCQHSIIVRFSDFIFLA